MSEKGSEEESEQEEVDEEEIARQQAAAKNRQSQKGGREGVQAETWTADPDWKPPSNPKDPRQRESIKNACTKSFMFAALAPEQLEQVLDAFYGPHDVDVGSEVIRQGAAVTNDEPGLYIVETGTLDVYKSIPDKDHPGMKVFTFDKAGQAFGEMALLYNCPRTATVIATSPSSLWSINRDTFNALVKGAAQEMLTKREKFLESIELLKDLSGDERAKIAEVLRSVIYQPGEKIIVQGDDGNDFFLLEEGSAHAEVTGVGRVKEYGAGSYFGELALTKKQPRSASVVADASPTKCLALDGDSFRRMLGSLDSIMNERAKDYEKAARGGGPPQVAAEPRVEVQVGGDENDSIGMAAIVRWFGALCACQDIKVASRG